MNLKSKLNGKSCFQTNPVKYFRIKTDKALNWMDHSNEFVINLNRAYAMLCKVSINRLKSIYCAMFHSHLNYGNLVWGRKKGNSSEKGIKIEELQTWKFSHFSSNSGFKPF